MAMILDIFDEKRMKFVIWYVRLYKSWGVLIWN